EKTKKNIEDAIWYHGFRPRKDAIRLIVNPGDFLVRATDTGPTTDIVITAMDANRKTVNITLRFDSGSSMWFIAQKSTLPAKFKFPTIVDLIDHYRVHAPSKHLKLSNVITRPTWMIKHEHVVYEEKDKLGADNFCSVYRGKLTTGQVVKDVAVKISLVAQSAVDMESEEAKESRKAMQEAQIMSYYSHDNIIQFYGIACDHQPLLVVMEFCAGGDLLSHLLKHGKKTDEKEKMIYLYEASRGMFYLHQKRCVHRDLAARNCLISNQEQIKIADFGESEAIDDEDRSGKNKNASNAQVPVRWMAPETLRKDAPPKYSNASDIWTFGVMTYEVFSNGIKPWPEDPVKFVATQIRKGNMPKLPAFQDSRTRESDVVRIRTMEPNKRPTMRQIAREFNTIIKDSTSSSGSTYGANEMTINQIPGVTREEFFEHTNTSEFDDSYTTLDNDSFDKVEKSGDGGRPKHNRTKPSKSGPKRGSSLRESK
ncbi:hypothetical protein PENTCL1PPCAC_11158, partial [Pristionchus entomophagus]